MTSPLTVGIDLGTQSVRVQALTADGRVEAASSAPLHSKRTEGRHEQDPAQWWTATREALRSVTSSLEHPSVIQAVAVSGTSGTIVPVDAVTGRPTGSAAMYDDARGAAQLDRVQSTGAALWHRLGYRTQASWGLPKLLAMLAEGDLAPGSVFAHQPDVITARLAGRLLPSDLSSALKSGADLDDVTWPEGLFDELGLPLSTLNALAFSGQLIGEVGVDGSADTGLPVGCAIIAGMTDGCAAQIAAGALRDGSWNSVLGTTLVIKGAVHDRRIDESGAIYAHRGPFGVGWFPGGASSTGAGAIAELLPARDLDALSGRFDASAAPRLAYPLVGRGERFPFIAPDARGIMPGGDDDAVFSAILHGVAAVERLAFDLIAGRGYDVADPILLTGGGSRNPAWNQLRADMLGRSVGLPAHSEGAAGMAMLAAAGRAVSDGDSARPTALSETADRMTRTRTEIDPDLARHERLMPSYLALVEELGERGWVPRELVDVATSGARS